MHTYNYNLNAIWTLLLSVDDLNPDSKCSPFRISERICHSLTQQLTFIQLIEVCRFIDLFLLMALIAIWLITFHNHSEPGWPKK